MIKIFASLLFLLLIHSITLLSQNLYKKIELSGSISYSYASYNQSPNSMFAKEELGITNVIFTPSVGYFLNNNFEILLEPTIMFYSVKDVINAANYAEFTEEYFTPSIGTGLVYNFNLNETIVPFVGLKAAIQWTKFVPEITTTTSWSKPSISFPNITLGGKIFLADKCALIAQVQYLKRTNPFVYFASFENSSMIIFGIGFSLFI